MVALKAARALGASVIALVVAVGVWSVVTQAPDGRWSAHALVEFSLLFIVALAVAILAVCVPVFILLGRLGLPARPAAAAWAGAILSAIPAVIVFGLFLNVDGDTPRTINAWIHYWPMLPLFAFAGGVFGFVWSTPRYSTEPTTR